MSGKYRGIIPIVAILLIGSTPIEKNISLSSFYSLRFLKNSNAPVQIKITKTDNTVNNRVVIEKGILVSYKNRKAKEVRIAGSFSGWNEIHMEKGKHGVWYFFLEESKCTEPVSYKFVVNGIWTLDPKNNFKENDKNGSYVSLIKPINIIEGRRISYRHLTSNMVEFRVYNPNASFISLVGDFNNWNPENDNMIKGRDGIWRLQKRINIGLFRYKFVIDGKWVVDYYNDKSASDGTGGICSVINIK